MDYQETLQFLFSQFASYQRVGAQAYKANLNNANKLDSHFGHPHRHYRTIHVAGTNGKGSVSHMLSSILMAAGYNVGLYTSPHLRDFRERIRVNGQLIPEELVVSFVQGSREILTEIQPSFFEITAAMAFQHFANQRVDIAVIEVGLGGRLDSTNIITPMLSIITNIGMDHTDLLGNTLQAIASEKAGIIKPRIPVVICQRQEDVEDVFKSYAKTVGAPISFANDEFRIVLQELKDKKLQHFEVEDCRGTERLSLNLDLLGAYQSKNLLGVLAACKRLAEAGIRIGDNHIQKGLSGVAQTTGLQGRWQVIGSTPLTICDTAHNSDGIANVVNQIRTLTYNRLHLVIGMVSDKDVDGVLSLLPKEATYYFTKAHIPRALDQNTLNQRAQKHNLMGSAYPTVAAALESAKKNALPNDLIFIGGSTFVVAEVV